MRHSIRDLDKIWGFMLESAWTISRAPLRNAHNNTVNEKNNNILAAKPHTCYRFRARTPAKITEEHPSNQRDIHSILRYSFRAEALLRERRSSALLAHHRLDYTHHRQKEEKEDTGKRDRRPKKKKKKHLPWKKKTDGITNTVPTPTSMALNPKTSTNPPARENNFQQHSLVVLLLLLPCCQQINDKRDSRKRLLHHARTES